MAPMAHLLSIIMEEMHWLLKAEPDSRIVKGKDVKFSVDDFETVKTSAWEGALFYHSNCKNPGIAAFVEVRFGKTPRKLKAQNIIVSSVGSSIKAHNLQDTAWDSSHPYYDPKSDETSPKWFMVDLTFEFRAKHFVSLALLKYISEHASVLPEELAYIGSEGAKAIKGKDAMDLINRGRLSVQRVQKPAWDTIKLLAERGGWNESIVNGKRKATKGKSKSEGSKDKQHKDKEPTGSTRETRSGKRKEIMEEKEERLEETDAKSDDRGLSEKNEDSGHSRETLPGKTEGKNHKRKAMRSEDADERPSTRARTRR
ncbi:DUF55-domain-containing protein [Lentinula aciculospora]|uniref:DUF55-domain-containing protein n=1 Tax=Lentinula aciculospora TaxID=153920 RepID=A0A9W9ABI9_9AGAR|nr:DUF55-domain-containing protein [Lentinula aciculospora]